MFKKEIREFDTMDPVLKAILAQDVISRREAMGIPSFSGCVKYISETVASLTIRLYKRSDDEVTEIKDDNRTKILNGDTGDILTGYQFKRSLVEDMLIEGAGYAYINKERNNIKSLHYVARPNIAFLPGEDPIFKGCFIQVSGSTYREFDFLKVIKKTKDGVRGIGILSESLLALAVPYNALKMENTLLKTGGNKRGFIKAERVLEKSAIDALKESWRNLYSNNSENIVVLNNGLDFKEASSTAVELQMNESKQTNYKEICKLFTLPASILDGNASNDEHENAIRMAVLPLLISIESSLNRDLLLEDEKGTFFFSFDTRELLKTSMEKRFNAYKLGIESNVYQIDEVREMENLPPLGLDFIKLNLSDVLFDPVARTIYTPNTGLTSDLSESGAEILEKKPESGQKFLSDEGGGEKDED